MEIARPHDARRDRSSRLREALIGISLVLTSAVLGFVMLELALRTFGTDERRWQWGNFLQDTTVTTGRWRILRPDPELGHIPQPGYSGTDHAGRALLSFDENGLRTHGPDAPRFATDVPPLLVVGDSYAMGEEVADNETFPAHLEELLNRPVLNGGVLGYGIDQMVLRTEKLVPEFRPGVLVVSFIADDVRRTEMRVLWGIEKPYFEVSGEALVLRNVPVPPPIAAMQPLDPVRQVLGHSFLVDVTMRRLGLEWWLRGRPMHYMRAHDDGPKVSCLLMNRLGQLKDRYGMSMLVVGKYTPNAWKSASTLLFEAGIVAKVLDCAKGSGLQTLDTREEMAEAVRSGGIEGYYINRHNNDAGNRLLAELAAERLLPVASTR